MGEAQPQHPDVSSSPPAAPADACVSVSPQDPVDAKTPPTSSTWRRAAARVLKWCWDQWFLLGLGVAIAFAAAVPQLGASGGWIQAQYSIKIPAIIVIFLISGIGLKTRVLLQVGCWLWQQQQQQQQQGAKGRLGWRERGVLLLH